VLSHCWIVHALLTDSFGLGLCIHKLFELVTVLESLQSLLQGFSSSFSLLCFSCRHACSFLFFVCLFFLSIWSSSSFHISSSLQLSMSMSSLSRAWSNFLATLAFFPFSIPLPSSTLKSL